MSRFIKSTCGPYTVWQWEEWKAAGRVHGFIGATGDFSDANLSEELPRFRESFAGAELFLPKQVHGVTSIDISMGLPVLPCEGDAVLSSCSTELGRCVGVRTADCVPLLIQDDKRVGAIHAGWRGLAGGIIQKVLGSFNRSHVEILIGPCAGPGQYEVGPEVLDALGSFGVAVEKGFGKYLLHLSETARKMALASGVSNDRVHSLPICTITDVTFHSFRRQKDLRGSNLSFIRI